MKTQIPPPVVIGLLVLAIVVVGWLGYMRFRPGPQKAFVGLGPPADLIRNQPPIIGPDGKPIGQSGTAVGTGPSGGSGPAQGGIRPPPAPQTQGFQGGGPPPPGPPSGYR